MRRWGRQAERAVTRETMCATRTTRRVDRIGTRLDLSADFADCTDLKAEEELTTETQRHGENKKRGIENSSSVFLRVSVSLWLVLLFFCLDRAFSASIVRLSLSPHGSVDVPPSPTRTT